MIVSEVALLLVRAGSQTQYKVDVDPQFVIPILYITPLIIGVMLHKYAPRYFSLLPGIIFTACFAYFAYILYLDYAIWKFTMPIIVVLGGLSGLSGWFRFLLRKVKNIGNDDSYLS